MLVPVRDRETELAKLVTAFQYCLATHPYRVYVVEQVSGKPFNKGSLLNAGFLESQKDDASYNYYLMNDVDSYPVKENTLDYTPIEGIKHLYGHQFGLGGIFLFSKSVFLKTNGFSNAFWGWGYEDMEFEIRLNYAGIKTDRNSLVIRGSSSNIVDHIGGGDMNSQNKVTYESKLNDYSKDRSAILQDGISNCQYQVLKVTVFQNDRLKRLLVEL